MTVNTTFAVSQLTSLAMNASATDPDGDAVNCAWNLGDGSAATGSAVTNTYAGNRAATGTLTVALQGSASIRPGSRPTAFSLAVPPAPRVLAKLR